MRPDAANPARRGRPDAGVGRRHRQ